MQYGQTILVTHYLYAMNTRQLDVVIIDGLFLSTALMSSLMAVVVLRWGVVVLSQQLWPLVWVK